MANKVAGELYESLTGQLFEIGRQLRQPNGYPYDPMELKAHLQAAIEGRFPKSEFQSYPVDVNYDLPVKAMVKAGKYDYANSDVNDANFRTTRSGQAEVGIILVHFNRVISTEDALKELDRQGLRPAELPELLAFGDEFPKKQLKFPIVALGSVWQDRGGSRLVPCLDGGGLGRGLYLLWAGDGWVELCRFAAVRK